MSDTRQAGFTLLEILVALVVLGFLLAGLSQGVQFGLKAWTNQSRILSNEGDADAVDRVLRRLIEYADPGRATVAAGLRGGPGSLVLITELTAEARSERSGQVQADIGVDAGKRLVLRWAPYLHATNLIPPPAPHETVLLAGVDHLELAYWGADPAHPTAARDWHSSWQGPNLPDLVRIRLVFAKGDPRHWPAIVAAPMRGKSG